MNALKQWQEESENNSPLEQEIARLLEWFLGDCLHAAAETVSGSRLQNWYPDGMAWLEIAAVPAGFQVSGVSWILYDGSRKQKQVGNLAPFELELQTDPQLLSDFRKCLLKIGQLDWLGRPCLIKDQRDHAQIFESRPRTIREWACAVELTEISR